MIKRIIFDLDETLIFWKKEYSLDMIDVVSKSPYNIDPVELDKILDSQEKTHDKISDQYIKEDIKKYLNVDVSDNFIKYIKESQYPYAEYDEKLEDVIKYLSSKYDLVVLTNWFKDVQEERLKTAGILKYFTKVVGGEECLKPIATQYINDNYLYSECMFVGDSDKFDIEPAKKLGMSTYKVSSIEDIYKLKEML